ncbi:MULTISPECIES: FdtA/QdtA family cupin domain-containing protein [unclassified Sphingomonas]|uniref:sugar 3,4-ketoisomerase n=1 Tax=unclassified Sphingomonas TaxID=196159 RepID=UPI00226B1745|nr:MULTISPECIES: FdtA/QdtA family cupin domain-containing protein [unclassified Sphingomonas]
MSTHNRHPAGKGGVNGLSVGNCQMRSLTVLGDARGSLIALEQGDALPTIARVYYIYGTNGGASRGFHAHRLLEQLAVCVAGSCTIVVDDGVNRADVRLDRPDLGLSISRMIWREMHDFSPDCVLMVLASRHYEPVDYIWSYDEFVRLAQLYHSSPPETSS